MALKDDEYRAVVQKVVLLGKHGPYVVTKCEKLGSVTFALEWEVWQEKDLPSQGTFVVLTDLRKKPAGWRAGSARYYRPSDVGSTS